MSNETAEIKLTKEFYATLNRGDIPALVGFLHPQVTRIEFEGTPGEGRFRGLDELRGNFQRGRSTWAEGGCEPQHLVVAGHRVIVDVHVRVRLKDKTEWLDGHITDGFRFKDGKIIEFHSFSKKEDALKWADTHQSN